MAPWKELGARSPYWNALIWDSAGQYFPWRDFAARALRGGTIPLWNPFQFCGTPFLANGQSALFYPLNLIFWIFDTRRAFGLSALLHLWLAGWFAYLFLRAIRLGRFGATVGAVAFALNGYFITWLYLPTIMASSTWLPLALLLGEKFLRRGAPLFAAGAGAALGFSALAGHPQIFLLCAIFFAVYFLLRGAYLGQWLRLIGGGLLIVAGAALLAAVQLAPMAELLRYSHRVASAGGAGYYFYLAWALPWQNLTTLLLPDFFGNPSLSTYWGKGNYAEFCTYAGVLPLMLALMGAVYGRGFHGRFFAITALFLLLCAFGTPLNWPLFNLVPGMDRAGSPARLLLLYLFSVAFLAGIGANWLAQAAALRPAAWLRARLLVIILLLVIFAVLVAFLAKETIPLLPDLPASEAFADARPNLVWLVVVALAAIVLSFALGRTTRWLRNALAAAVVLLIVVDLLLFGFRYLRFSPRQEVYPNNEVVSFLQQHAGSGRILALSPGPLANAWPASELPQIAYMLRGLRPFPQAVFPPNAAMVYSLRDVLGYDSLYLADYRELMGQLEGHDPSPPTNGNMLLADEARRDLLGPLGVRYLLSKKPLAGRDLRLVRDGLVKIYEVLPASSRAWLADSSFTPATAGTAEISADDIDHVRVEANLPAAGYLVLADGFYPGWQAYAAGREVTIARARKVFRAVWLPAGNQTVDFYYRPAAFKVGLFAFLVAIAIVAAWSAIGITAGKKQS